MEKNKTASNWTKAADGAVKCDLCPHHCLIKKGGRGICGIRRNVDGKLIAEAYGIYPAVHMDPIEKKPLNHFMPGSMVLSLGSVGCNMTCKHCQNWSLSRDGADGKSHYYMPPKLLVERATSRGSIGVAFTYNEPTINHEYLMEVCPRLKEKGARVVLVTNGYLEEGPWTQLMENTDGANIDVKAFTDRFYKETAGATLEPVLRNVEIAVAKGVHVEIAYLVIPAHNDSEKEIDRFLDWVLNTLGPDVPLHFNRFHPDHLMMDIPPTPRSTLERIRNRALERGVRYVYLGNIGGRDYNSTRCPGCNKVVIDRDGFLSGSPKVKNGKCSKCGHPIAGVWS